MFPTRFSGGSSWSLLLACEDAEDARLLAEVLERERPDVTLCALPSEAMERGRVDRVLSAGGPIDDAVDNCEVIALMR
jgi:hypothetical protein